jgi:hypothetical protein
MMIPTTGAASEVTLQAKKEIAMEANAARCALTLPTPLSDPDRAVWRVSFRARDGSREASSLFTLNPRAAWQYWSIESARF